MTDIPANEIGFGNYLVAFVDLLGQRNALAGQTILPEFNSAEEHEAFKQIAMDSIGAIVQLQKDSEAIVSGAKESKFGDLKENLPEGFHSIVDDLYGATIKTQRWSDGLVYYYCLRGSNIVRDLGAIYNLVTRVGSLTLLGLARKTPMRGGMEISWGVELHENELYGPAVANAYELESKVAQFPRVVLGHSLVRYLMVLLKHPDQDMRGQFIRRFAGFVLSLIAQDAFGTSFVHYLHPEFMHEPDNPHREVYKLALQYIDLQLLENEHCEKLATRYTLLRAYFAANAP